MHAEMEEGEIDRVTFVVLELCVYPKIHVAIQSRVIVFDIQSARGRKVRGKVGRRWWNRRTWKALNFTLGNTKSIFLLV